MEGFGAKKADARIERLRMETMRLHQPDQSFADGIVVIDD
jgi:hypothetical protein